MSDVSFILVKVYRHSLWLPQTLPVGLCVCVYVCVCVCVSVCVCVCLSLSPALTAYNSVTMGRTLMKLDGNVGIYV